MTKERTLATFINELILLLGIVFIVIITGCQKDEDTSCLGCNIDTSFHEFEFKVSGILRSDCSGEPAPFKTIEFYNIYIQDSLLVETQTDGNGHFNFSYKRTLQGAYQYYSKWASVCILKVKDDSITYFLPGLTNLENLDLTLNDSIDLLIFFEFDNNPVTETRTLFYRFEPWTVPNAAYTYKISGPLSNHQLINHIKDKWRFIDLDKYEGPALKMYWRIDYPGGSITSSGFRANATKLPCIMREDSLIIYVR